MPAARGSSPERATPAARPPARSRPPAAPPTATTTSRSCPTTTRTSRRPTPRRSPRLASAPPRRRFRPVRRSPSPRSRRPSRIRGLPLRGRATSSKLRFRFELYRGPRANPAALFLCASLPNLHWTPMTRRTFGLSLGMMAIASLVLRLGYLRWQAGNDPTYWRPMLDGAVYLGWARSLAGGLAEPAGAFYLAPLYPHVLAGFFSVFGEAQAGL